MRAVRCACLLLLLMVLLLLAGGDAAFRFFWEGVLFNFLTTPT